MYLEGNPLEKKELCNIMACLALNPSLIKVNGKVVTKQVHRTFVLGVKEPPVNSLQLDGVSCAVSFCAQEKQLVVMLDRPVMRMALQQGWMLSASSVSNAAGLERILQNTTSCGFSVPRCHESKSVT